MGLAGEARTYICYMSIEDPYGVEFMNYETIMFKETGTRDSLPAVYVLWKVADGRTGLLLHYEAHPISLGPNYSDWILFDEMLDWR